MRNLYHSPNSFSLGCIQSGSFSLIRCFINAGQANETFSPGTEGHSQVIIIDYLVFITLLFDVLVNLPYDLTS